MATYLDTICQHLSNKNPVVLVSNISQKGSIPRSVNMRMTVSADGTIRGTVGGGSYEAKVIEAAQSMIADDEIWKNEGALSPAKLLRFSMSGTTGADLDPISGGAIDFLVEPLPPRLAPMFLDAAEKARQGKHFVFVTHASFKVDFNSPNCPLTGALVGTVERSLYGEGHWYASTGSFTPPPEAQHYLRGTYLRDSRQQCYYEEHDLWILAPFDPYPKAVIFGSGHISAETALLTDKIGFVTIVADDRRDLLTLQRFPHAETLILSDCAEQTVMSLVLTNPLSADDAVIILTQGIERCLAILSAALCSHAGYIGMHATPLEKEEIFAALRKQGVPEERLAFVHTPIGLPIQAAIPEETAVAIAAEVISWRSKKKGVLQSFAAE